MNILRTPVFRKIYRTEAALSVVMLMMPIVLAAAKYLPFTANRDGSFLMPGAAIMTTLRLLLMLSLANLLAEASAAAQHFHRAKNWCLMQSVTEASALLFNITLIVMQSRPVNLTKPHFLLLAGGYLCYVLILQLFDYFAAWELMRGFRSVWRLCGGDASLERQLRLTHGLLIMSCVLIIPVFFLFILQRESLRLIMRILSEIAMMLVYFVQLRMTFHAGKTAGLLAALSE